MIPDRPSSWIGKMHAYGKSLKATRVCPRLYETGVWCGTEQCQGHCWWVLDGSPASCTQIGLFNMGWAASEFDIVVSGPNHGRNASTIFNLSSGTVGGALEGALCGKRAISLSFGSKDPQLAAIIEAACSRAVDLIAMLVKNWNPEVELYNVNIPMIKSVTDCPTEFSVPTRSYWKTAALYQTTCNDPEITGQSKMQPINDTGNEAKYFKWQPDMTDINTAAKLSNPGEDLWMSKHGIIS
jgi:5'/3'-nucleotidase SurE